MSSADAVEIPLIKATNETLKGYGYLIDSYENSEIEIVTWPKQGWRELMKVQVMKVEALKDHLMLGGKVAHCMDKIMPFNITVIMK
jgi:hypothetical protein